MLYMWYTSKTKVINYKQFTRYNTNLHTIQCLDFYQVNWLKQKEIIQFLILSIYLQLVTIANPFCKLLPVANIHSHSNILHFLPKKIIFH